MRKQIVVLGAAAAVVSGFKGDTRDTQQPATLSATRRLPILLQGTNVAASFANAKTVEEFRRAEAIWITLRPDLAKFEISLNCKDYGAAHDKDIAIDLVGELVKKPVGLMIDVGKLVLALAGTEKDESSEALKDAFKELLKLAEDKGFEKVAEKVAEKAARGKTIERFKEALLKFLQAYSKRSRKHFLQVIADILSVAKAYGGLVLQVSFKAVQVALTPSRINPEECGLEKSIELERDAALRRVFRSTEK